MNMKKIMVGVVAGALAVSSLTAVASAQEWNITYPAVDYYDTTVVYNSGDIDVDKLDDSGVMTILLDTANTIDENYAWGYAKVKDYSITLKYFAKQADGKTKATTDSISVKKTVGQDNYWGSWGDAAFEISYNTGKSATAAIANLDTDSPVAISVTATISHPVWKTSDLKYTRYKQNDATWLQVAFLDNNSKDANGNYNDKESFAGSDVNAVAATATAKSKVVSGSESVKNLVDFASEFRPNSILRDFGNSATVEIVLNAQPYSETGEPVFGYIPVTLKGAADVTVANRVEYATFDADTLTATITLPEGFVYYFDKNDYVYGGILQVGDLKGGLVDEDGNAIKIASIKVKSGADSNANDTSKVITVNNVTKDGAVAVIGTYNAIFGNADKLDVTNEITDKTISYKLTLTNAGAASQLTGEVTLQLSIPAQFKGQNLTSNTVKHTCNDGTVEELAIENLDTYKTDGYVVVKTSKFSSFELGFEGSNEETTTEAPAVSEETTTEAPADTQPADDGNQPTGVALAVIPAIVAAAGIVISKKRG